MPLSAQTSDGTAVEHWAAALMTRAIISVPDREIPHWQLVMIGDSREW